MLTACVELLLRAGADPNVCDNRGYIALHTVLDDSCGAEGVYSCVRALLAGGADPSARSRDGFSPLHMAAWEGQHASAAALLDAGAQREARTANDGLCTGRHTPLHEAALVSLEPRCLAILLGRDADIGARSGDLFAVVHFLYFSEQQHDRKKRCLDCAQELVLHSGRGALDITTNDGETALQMSMQFGGDELLSSLRALGCAMPSHPHVLPLALPDNEEGNNNSRT